MHIGGCYRDFPLRPAFCRNPLVSRSRPTSHLWSEYLTCFLYGIILYSQDTQYFPVVTSSVMHGPIVSYRIIILFYYCVDLDTYIHINTNINQDGHPYIFIRIYIQTDGSENESCVYVCMCMCVCKYTNTYIKVERYGTFRFIVHICYHSIRRFHNVIVIRL